MEDLNSIINGHIIDDHFVYEKSFWYLSQHHYHFIPHVRKIYLSIDELKKNACQKEDKHPNGWQSIYSWRKLEVNNSVKNNINIQTERRS